MPIGKDISGTQFSASPTNVSIINPDTKVKYLKKNNNPKFSRSPSIRRTVFFEPTVVPINIPII